MQRRHFLEKTVAGGLAVAASCLAPSCGALIYPERVGQPRGRLDPSVVILDGLGLLLFLVPGLVAFAVDFGTGAIYLPPQYVGQHGSKRLNAEGYLELHRDPRKLTREGIEAAVAEASGLTIRLDPGAYQATPLGSLRDMPDAEIRLAAMEHPGPTEVIFRCQSSTSR